MNIKYILELKTSKITVNKETSDSINRRKRLKISIERMEHSDISNLDSSNSRSLGIRKL
jgi:hypothetical protein